MKHRPTGTGLLGEVVPGVALLAGAANVIMQMSHPAVGYGVVESKVDSGSVLKHPIKRARTTYTYLAVAMMGSPQEKAAFRRAVDQVHQHVRSDQNSPVAYNAFDRNLQLWVAACLYRGLEDTVRVFGPHLNDEQWDDLYQQAATLATTLQVTTEMWPADRAAFAKYWDEQLASLVIDDTVRNYLNRLFKIKAPGPLRAPASRFYRFVTTGFLPQHFQDQMQLPWTPEDQQRWDTVMRRIRRVVRLMPPLLRRFPFNACLWDLRRRIATGRQLV